MSVVEKHLKEAFAGAIPYIALSARNRRGADAAQAYNDLGVAYSVCQD